MPFHHKIKSFVNKVREKQDQRTMKSKEDMAKAKGFSSFGSYETYTALARKEGYDEAKKKLRKSELQRVKKEEYLDTMDTRPKYVKKVQRGVQTFRKGMDEFNTVMDEIKGITQDTRSFNKG